MGLADKREELAKKSAELKKFTDDNPIENMTADQVAEFRRRNDELGPLADEVKTLSELVEADKKNRERVDTSPVPMPGPVQESKAAPRKSGLQTWIGSDEFKAFRDGRSGFSGVDLPFGELKNTIALTDWTNEPTRLPSLVPSAQEERTVRDLALQGTTDNNSITYMEETTFTNNAAPVAEAGAKPESALDFTKRTVIVEKIATWVQMTKEILDDVSGFESYVRGRLMFMVKRQEEVQLLTGSGTTPALRGYLNASGVQSQAKGADTTADAIYKGINLVRNTGFAEPNGVVMHPNDWIDVRLMKTADGIYIWGAPMDAGPERIWGLPVRVTTAETEGIALVGAFTPMSQVFQREGITISISTEHASNFVSNIITVLAEERLALAIYRGSAFCRVTGV